MRNVTIFITNTLASMLSSGRGKSATGLQLQKLNELSEPGNGKCKWQMPSMTKIGLLSGMVATMLFFSAGVAHAEQMKIGGNDIFVQFKDGDVGYYDLMVKQGEERPYTTEIYIICGSKSEHSRFVGVDKGQYPADTLNQLCLVRMRRNAETAADENKFAVEIAKLSDDNKMRLPEKKLDVNSRAVAVTNLVEKFRICPEGYQFNLNAIKDEVQGAGFYIAPNHMLCGIKASCKLGYTRAIVYQEPGTNVYTECRRYGDCPANRPIRFFNSDHEELCGSCAVGGCADTSRSSPLCAINMKNPLDFSHCKEQYRTMAIGRRDAKILLEPLFTAIRSGDTEKVLDALKNKPPVNEAYPSPAGKTALQYAISEVDGDPVKSETQTNQVIDALLAAGADVNMINTGTASPTPVLAAIQTGKTLVFKHLLEKGALFRDADSIAEGMQNPDFAEFLLASGYVDWKSTYGSSKLIHIAASVGNVLAVKKALEGGVDVNEGADYYQTPLVAAIAGGRACDPIEKVALFLIERGADVDLHERGTTSAVDYILGEKGDRGRNEALSACKWKELKKVVRSKTSSHRKR